MNKLISIIVNCNNGEKYLEKCISSILKQTYKNFEIIFFDNFSSDNSKNIISNFNDKRIKYYYSSSKLALYEARNKALEKASGELIAFLDVDDWWDKNYLSIREDFFRDEKIDFFYSNGFVYYEKIKKLKKYRNKLLPGGKIYKFLAKDYFIIISGLIIRKKIFEKIGNFNKNFNIIGDFDFVMRMSENYNSHAHNQPLFIYRSHEDNFSKKNLEIFYKEFEEWYHNQEKINKKNFNLYKSYFRKKLLLLEIKYLLFNTNRNFNLLLKIFYYPDYIEKIKYLILFFTPKIIIKHLVK